MPICMNFIIEMVDICKKNEIEIRKVFRSILFRHIHIFMMCSNVVILYFIYIVILGWEKRNKQVLPSRLRSPETQVLGWIPWTASITRTSEENVTGHPHHQVNKSDRLCHCSWKLKNVSDESMFCNIFLPTGLRCRTTYGVKDATITLAWVFDTMQKSRRLVITIQPPSTSSGWSATYVTIILRSRQIQQWVPSPCYCQYVTSVPEKLKVM